MVPRKGFGQIWEGKVRLVNGVHCIGKAESKEKHDKKHKKTEKVRERHGHDAATHTRSEK
ncbi:unnamed protein product [Sphenostylis stenocarpa]|uniref:Uncharacterized protein n=1 Tax=Sphenostylis stenocarpa TaxID=92480 RepID=A0AA86SXP8_9FABA|nr:unnamed protein product [Sphenostylis stenocarpa]